MFFLPLIRFLLTNLIKTERCFLADWASKLTLYARFFNFPLIIFAKANIVHGRTKYQRLIFFRFSPLILHGVAVCWNDVLINELRVEASGHCCETSHGNFT